VASSVLRTFPQDIVDLLSGIGPPRKIHLPTGYVLTDHGQLTTHA
jgi:hypothetical protein